MIMNEKKVAIGRISLLAVMSDWRSVDENGDEIG